MIIALAERDGAIHRPEGLDVEAVVKHQKATGSILNFPGAKNLTPTQRALDQSLPDGTPQARATVVLDSLAFAHSRLDPRDSTITAMKREPHASDRLVFSTLRVVLKFTGDGRLMQRTAREVFTGP